MSDQSKGPPGRSYITVAGVRVEERIFTTPYTCDPEFYSCQSQCCCRGCILHQVEIERIRLHLSEIASFLPPEEGRALAAKGCFVADCATQCPAGCEIHGLEWEALRLHFPEGDPPHCLSYPDQMCLFAYERNGVRLCAIHSYALKGGLGLSEVKPLDCIQYPLCLGEDEEGRFLGVQETPNLAHIPCLKDPQGEVMVLSLGYAIEALLGKEFYQQLLQAFERYVSSPIPGAHRP